MATKWRLFDAIKKGKRDVSKVLFAAGAASDYREEADGSTCLYWACVHGDAFMARALLESGARLNQRTREGDTPCRAAARSKGDEIVQLLLDYKADKEDVIEEILGGYGCGDTWDETTCRRLLEGADARQRGRYLQKACTRVINDRRYEPLRFLLQAGVDPNLPLDGTGEPLLCFLLQRKLPSSDAESWALDMLLAAGADIYRKYPIGVPNAVSKGNGTRHTTPLEWALYTECTPDTVIRMLKAQPLRNRTAAEIDVYVTYVCRTLKTSLLRVMIVDGQLDLGYQDEKGNVMMTKICHGLNHIKVHGLLGMRRAGQVVTAFVLTLDMLRDAGSNPRVRNHEGRCPLDFFRDLASYSGPDRFYRELSQYIRMDGDKLVLTSRPDITLALVGDGLEDVDIDDLEIVDTGRLEYMAWR
jgi:ankyrin repeat protein